MIIVVLMLASLLSKAEKLSSDLQHQHVKLNSLEKKLDEFVEKVLQSSKPPKQPDSALRSEPKHVVSRKKDTGSASLLRMTSTSSPAEEERMRSDKPVPSVEASMDSIREEHLKPISNDVASQSSVAKAGFCQPAARSGPPEFERKAQEILSNIWQWFLYGGDYQKNGMSREYAVASTWLVRSAIVIIVLGVGFFLKYSISRNWINETGRVLLSILAGLAMLGIGFRLAGKKYMLVGHGLLGGGIAVLYFSIFAAHGMYALINDLPAFGLMIVITVTAVVAAVRLNSLLTAILGVVGGYCTPIIIHTGQTNLAGLYMYFFLLGIGVLGMARHKDWTVLNILSFIFTYMIAVTALGFHYTSNDFLTAFTFFTLFYLLFSAIPIVYNIMHEEKSTVIELCMMLGNLSIYFGLSYLLIDREFGYRYSALVTTGLAVFYAAQVFFFLKKRVRDRNLLTILCGLSALCVAVTIPLALSGEWITAGWAILALVFLWMSRKLLSNFMGLAACVMYGITLLRIIAVDMHRHFFSISGTGYLREMLSRFSTMGMLVLSMAGAYWMLKKDRVAKCEGYTIFPENDIGDFKHVHIAADVFFWIFFSALFVFLHFECYYFADAFFSPMTMPMITLIWVGTLGFFLNQLMHTGRETFSALLCCCMIGLCCKLILVDLSFWELTTRFVFYDSLTYSFVSAVMRMINYAMAVGVFSMIYLKIRSSREKAREFSVTMVMFGVGALVFLFLYLSLEIHTVLFFYAPDARSGGVSLFWGVFALCLIAGGIRKNNRGIRYSGLILFLITVLKIFFVDTSRLSQGYRILIFNLVGLVCLGGAVVYIKFKDVFAVQDNIESEGQGGLGEKD